MIMTKVAHVHTLFVLLSVRYVSADATNTPQQLLSQYICVMLFGPTVVMTERIL